MRKLIVSEWLALDGVYDADTMEQWFNPYDSEARAEYIKQNVLTSGAMLIGRVTYEMFNGYWPNQKNNEAGIADKLNSMPKYVVSSTLKKADWKGSTIIKGRVVEEVTRLKNHPGQDIITFGSATLVQTLMQADLVDEFRFLLHPNMAGTGKRFFIDGMGTKLKLVRTETFDRAVVLLCYEPESVAESMAGDQAVTEGRVTEAALSTS